MSKPDPKIFLALDGMRVESALALTGALAPWVYAPKIHDLLDAEGPPIIKDLKETGIDKVWVDYKLHDAKDAVAGRVKALAKNGASVITVHASGGVPMMRAAVEAAQGKDGQVLVEIWAITVLTSLDESEIARIYGKERTPAQITLEFALMAKEAGVKTVVCSVQEVEMLSTHPDLAGMEFTVPGTRSAGVAAGQQKRLGTPAEAMVKGATGLVAGSQVTKAADPVAALKAFAAEIGTNI